MATAKYAALFFQSLANKEVDVDSDTFKLILVNGYTFNQDTHRYKDVSVTNELSTAGGYTAGGVTISPNSISYDAAANRLKFIPGSGASWAAATFTTTGAVLFDDTPASNKPIVGYIDFGGAQAPAGVTFSITFDPTNGFGYVDIAA